MAPTCLTLGYIPYRIPWEQRQALEEEISPRRPLRRHLLPKVANDTRAPPVVLLLPSRATARCPSRVNDGIYPCSALASHKDTWLAVDGLAFLHGGPRVSLHLSSLHLFVRYLGSRYPYPSHHRHCPFYRPPSSVNLVLAPRSVVCHPHPSTSPLPLGSTAYPEHLAIPVSWPCPLPLATSTLLCSIAF